MNGMMEERYMINYSTYDDRFVWYGERALHYTTEEPI